jgi:hypothetical protein
MTHVTVEYMILIPILILQIFLFPMVVTVVMNTWVDSRRALALQEAASYLGSSIQQVYSSLDHATIQAGTLTNKLGVQPFIEGYVYLGNASMRTDSIKVLDITLWFVGAEISATASVTLGQNVQWKSSTFMSNSTTQTCVTAEKFVNGTIQLYFGA